MQRRLQELVDSVKLLVTHVDELDGEIRHLVDYTATVQGQAAEIAELLGGRHDGHPQGADDWLARERALGNTRGGS